ncbi:MAG: putative baseplate assembly protein [Nostoc sp.]|uniref:putative baseplate assembly protein n=1 Tax=Nostoc sp. TaxID=1180 RepID=UPI002FFA0228
MNEEHCCGCEGEEILTPTTKINRPGLDNLAYRVGTHASFVETMKARLSSSDFPALANLKTRDTSDPSIALLDAWAMVADVLTFYQERIANEGYLRTAKEQLSVRELARIVDYSLRPGVSATVYLAFTLDKGYNIEVPLGTRTQSIPISGGLPQVFETSEKLAARVELNTLKPRTSQPQGTTISQPSFTLSSGDNSRSLTGEGILNATDATQIDKFYLQGTIANLAPNDPLLFVGNSEPVLRYVQAIEIQAAQQLTLVRLQLPPSASSSTSSILATDQRIEQIQQLLKPRSQQPANAFQLQRIPDQILNPNSQDIEARLMEALNISLKTPQIHTILTNIQDNLPKQEAKLGLDHNLINLPSQAPKQVAQILVLRLKGAPFGHNAPFRHIRDNQQISKYEEWPLSGNDLKDVAQNIPATEALPQDQWKLLALDRQYSRITPDSWVAIKRFGEDKPKIFQVKKVEDTTKTLYGITGRVTEITLDREWLTAEDTSLDILRKTTVYAQSEVLTLANKPFDGQNAPGGVSNFPQGDGKEIELDDLYEGLQPGRTLIISGERSDIPNISGVTAKEVVMVAGVRQGMRQILPSGDECSGNPNEKPHTFLQLALPLAYSYKPNTVTIYGNVVKATHGETHIEILGSGNATQEFQQFRLRQPPLTYLPASTPSGAVSTLKVFVNDVLWYEVESLTKSGSTDHCFVTHTDKNGNTTVIFGNGVNGVRLPSGSDNIKAVYRTGIGKQGNIAAEQINQLVTRPLGLKGVINPEAATGGTDGESIDQARRNAPLGMIPLNRAVSVQDYADFAYTSAGIGKASAMRLTDSKRQILHLTIARTDNILIDKNSDLHRNFIQSLHQFGDPYLPIQVDKYELMLLIISAKVRILQDFQWESIASHIHTALLNTFSFDSRELGQDVFLSEVISTIQQVPGVDYVDVDILESVCETEAQDPKTLHQKLENLATVGIRLGQEQPKQRISVNLARVDLMVGKGQSSILPAQLAILSPQVADTIILQQFKL